MEQRTRVNFLTRKRCSNTLLLSLRRLTGSSPARTMHSDTTEWTMCLIIPGIGLYIRRSKALTIASFVFVCSFFLPFLYMFFFLPHCRYTYSFSTNVSRHFFFFLLLLLLLCPFSTHATCVSAVAICVIPSCVYFPIEIRANQYSN